MSFIIKKITGITLFLFIGSITFSQYNWKLSKDKDGIQVYLSETTHSKFKSIKVECTFEGNYEKLIAIFTDIDHLKDWGYKTKACFLLKKNTANDFYYYTETSLPWPLSNRDVVIHEKIYTDSLPRFLKATSISEAGYVPELPGKERIPHLSINWTVTMPTAKTIHIIYIIEIDPGGGLPAWIVNSFADKGPYETFKKLEELLKK